MKDDEVKIFILMCTLPCEHYTLTLFLDFPWFKHTSIPSVKFAEQKRSKKRPEEFSDSILSQFRPNSSGLCKELSIPETQCGRKTTKKGHLIPRSTI